MPTYHYIYGPLSLSLLQLSPLSHPIPFSVQIEGKLKLMEETDCGSFFDHIDDLIDFPVEDMEAAGFPPVNNRQPITSIWSAQPETLPFSDDSTVFSNTHSSSDLSAELFVPYEDIVQLEWLSTFVEDSFSSESLTITKKIELPEDSNFNTPSPISVLLDSSSSSNSSCSGDKANLGPMMARCGRARSKRPRPTTFNPRSTFSLPETTANIDSSSDNFGESRYAIKMMKMKMKVRFKGPVEDRKESWQVRKCLHCEITKTPQWRAGPLGPKTLCNACGVRYKSGRLFPEYRPAASPTFMPSLHSNSHKKVAEMRSNVIMSTTTAPADDALIPHTACTPSACMIISEAFNIDHGKLTI